MQIKLLKSIVEEIIGKPAVPIIDLLMGKKNVNEFLIAKKLDLTINQARNILYKMSDYGLVSFIRKKDKRKGWYIYFWTLNIYQSLNLLHQNLTKELEQMEQQLKNRMEKRYYVCNTCNLEVSEEVALLNDFICSECEQVYVLSENKEVLEQLVKNIDRVKKEIEVVNIELENERSKMQKKKDVKIKRQEKEAKDLRKKRKELREKDKKKTPKKEVKKKPKSSK